MFRFLKLLGKNLAQGPSTDPFPAKEAHTPERFRGRVVVNPEQCVGCRICHHMCAGGAIRIEDNEEKTGYNFTVWHNTCALCGMCRHYCPTKAITLSTDWHNAHTQEDKYDWAAHYSIPYLACAGCGAPHSHAAPTTGSPPVCPQPCGHDRPFETLPKLPPTGCGPPGGNQQ